ncbi:putative cytochrome P450 [Cercophora scortea]|uniref:Cytochrome P450 n=1 Tax=Cercophora scortea TaxID=314031 RepID=A0AAE0I9Z5_9PEZI|nr:putative cytochrome P450 [Cercophora scortea]
MSWQSSLVKMGHWQTKVPDSAQLLWARSRPALSYFESSNHVLRTLTWSTFFLSVLSVFLGTIAWTSWRQWTTRQRLVPGIPVIGGSSKRDRLKNRERFRHDSKQMLTEGYLATNGGFFYVPSPLGERLMIPVQYLEDLKTAPIDRVDFVGTFIEMFEGKHTTFGSRSTLHPRTVKAELNQHLAEVMLSVQDEIHDTVQDIFPPCDDWTEVHIVDLITEVVARVSSRMFGGTTLSRNKDWVKASIAFAIDGYFGAQKLKKLPEFLKPLGARVIREVRNLGNYYKEAEKVAIPMLEERERTGEPAFDLLYWMQQAAVGEETDHKFIAGILLKISFAAIHTTASAAVQLLLDLCTYPELVPMVRDEYASVLAHSNDGEGRISRQGLMKMHVLDSIMKESQRFNPLLLVTFERIITEDWKLSDGFVIPAHTTIGVPAQAISMDPNLFPDPERFDGLRFAKIRNATTDPAVKGKAQFVAAHPQSMAFGYGRHACPGRFFAGDEIKAITAYLVKHYDMKFPEGQGRPASMEVETQYLPSHSATVLFKRRAVQ